MCIFSQFKNQGGNSSLKMRRKMNAQTQFPSALLLLLNGYSCVICSVCHPVFQGHPCFLSHVCCAHWLSRFALLPEILRPNECFKGRNFFSILVDQSTIDSLFGIIFNVQMSKNAYLHNKDIFSVYRPILKLLKIDLIYVADFAKKMLKDVPFLQYLQMTNKNYQPIARLQV